MARVVGLHRLTLSVPEIEKAGGFYRDGWGMRVVSRSGRRWHLQSRAMDHPDLALVLTEGASGLSTVALQVKDRAALSALLIATSQSGSRLLQAPGDSVHHPGEYCATVEDPDGNKIELVVPASAGTGPGDVPEAAGPLRIGHAVLWTPQIEPMESFYALLGLRVSDRTTIGMSFLRCNMDHHSVALARSSGRTGLQHVAFDVGTREAVEREKARLAADGVQCFWGPGRHGPGNNVFSYYRDPAGTIIEFYGEMQKVPVNEDPAEPVYWGPEHRGDITGVAGPAPVEFRS